MYGMPHLKMFGISYACPRDVRVMIEEFLLNLPFEENGRFLWRACLLHLMGVGGVLFPSKKRCLGGRKGEWGDLVCY